MVRIINVEPDDEPNNILSIPSVILSPVDLPIAILLSKKTLMLLFMQLHVLTRNL